MKNTKLAIVIPCYNEEETLPSCFQKIWDVLRKLINERVVSDKSFVFFVDDGSKDKTWELIENAHNEAPEIMKGLKFTRNFGNQSAILAGLEAVRKLDVDAAITIDADLQQDETKIKEFVEAYDKGVDIVAGVRNDRKTDGLFNKICSILFYKFMNMLGVNIQPNHSEYRLVSKRTLKILSNYKEFNFFLRGLFYELGLRTEYVYFDVKKREYGKSKFSFVSLLMLAAKGIVSLSVKPLRFVFLTGLIISGISFLSGIIYLIMLIYDGKGIPGVRPFDIYITFILGIQILCTGIIGEYVGQVLEETKARPRYLTDKELN